MTLAPWQAARRWWPWASVVVGLLVWFPAGWSLFGVSWRPPLQLIYGDVVFFGSFAAALAASLVVTRVGWRLAVVVVASLALWLVRPQFADAHPGEETLTAALYFGGQVLGFLVGCVLRRGPVRVAAALALVAAATTADRYAGWLAAAALVTAFLGVRRGRPATLAGGVGGAALAFVVWVAGRLGHVAIGYGWGAGRRGSGFPRSPEAAVRLVLEPALDFLRVSSATYVEALLQYHRTELVVGVVLAAAVALSLRVVRRPDPGPNDDRSGVGPGAPTRDAPWSRA